MILKIMRNLFEFIFHMHFIFHCDALICQLDTTMLSSLTLVIHLIINIINKTCIVMLT